MLPEPKDRVLYLGTHERTLDAKNRVAIPAPWSDDEGRELHIFARPGGEYLVAMPREELELQEQRIQAAAISESEKRDAKRNFFGAVRSAIPDKQGRVILNEDQCRAAGLTGDVVFVGSKSRFEIWAKDRYAERATATYENFKKVADLIGL